MVVVVLSACGGSTGTTEAVEVSQAPAPRLSEEPPASRCAMGRVPTAEAPSIDVDAIANIVVRSAAEAREVIDRHSPPGTDPDALFAVAHAQIDLYRLEHDQQVLQDAIRTWAQLIQTAPNDPRMDQALYQLAWALTEMDQHDRARQVYHRLIRHYPESPLIVAGYIHFGDYYVRERDGIAARRFYERAQSMVPEEDATTRAYLAYAYAWASHVAGESVDPAELEQARQRATDPVREAIETEWCAR